MIYRGKAGEEQSQALHIHEVAARCALMHSAPQCFNGCAPRLALTCHIKQGFQAVWEPPGYRLVSEQIPAGTLHRKS